MCTLWKGDFVKHILCPADACAKHVLIHNCGHNTVRMFRRRPCEWHCVPSRHHMSTSRTRSLPRFRAGHCVYIWRGGTCETNLQLSPQIVCKCVRSIVRSCAEDIASRAENTCTCSGNVIIHHSAQEIARAFLRKRCCETHPLPNNIIIFWMECIMGLRVWRSLPWNPCVVLVIASLTSVC